MKWNKVMAILVLSLTSASGAGCSGALTDEPRSSSSGSYQGDTSQAIRQRFAAIIEKNFTIGDTLKLVNNLNDRELAGLAALYQQETASSDGVLLDLFARRLDGAALTRVAQSFGYEPTARAVARSASAEIANAFIAHAPLRTPGFAPQATPTIDMTAGDIYLEYRTALVGSLTPGAALAETAIFMGQRLALAGWVGWQVGTQIHNAIETYAPEWDDVIGGTIASALENISQATNDVSRGQYEKAADDLFGGAVSTSPNVFGDWGVSTLMANYLSGSVGGSCKPILQSCNRNSECCADLCLLGLCN